MSKFQAQTRARWAAGSWGLQSTSLMASVPVSTQLRSWSVLGSVCQPTCCPTGLGVGVTLAGTGAAVTPRSGAALLTRQGPSGSSYSAKMAALGHTRLPWWPPASASATLDSRMTRVTRTHLSTVVNREKVRGRLDFQMAELEGSLRTKTSVILQLLCVTVSSNNSCLHHEVYR